MADKTKNWGITALTIQCWIARAVMLDEYLNVGEAALEVVDRAIAEFGAGTLLLRERAKIYWRAADHSNALAILRGIADQVGAGNSVERAFALREAAISAANCNDWRQARQWFAEAQRSATSSKTENMEIMALGLGADAAIAALMDGDANSALRGLTDALAGLSSVTPDASLRAAYLNRVTRHAVLWALNKISETDIEISGKAIAILPGCCSNTEPTPSIKDSPLASLDTAWYLLAEAEVAAGVNTGIADGLYPRLIGGKIPVLESSLRRYRICKAIEGSDTDRFAHLLRNYLSRPPTRKCLARERTVVRAYSSISMRASSRTSSEPRWMTTAMSTTSSRRSLGSGSNVARRGDANDDLDGNSCDCPRHAALRRLSLATS